MIMPLQSVSLVVLVEGIGWEMAGQSERILLCSYTGSQHEWFERD